MLTLRWRKIAIRDVARIVDYITEDNRGAAQKLSDDIRSKVETLRSHPKIGRPGRMVGTREFVVRSNYVVIYTEDDSSLRILRVLHTAQLWPPRDN